MLRIALIIVIAAALGGVGVSFKVSDKITNLTTERDTNAKGKEDAEAAATAAKSAEKKAKDIADKATKELVGTKDSLAKASTDRDEQTKRANTLSDQLTKTTAEKTEAQQELSAWHASGYSVVQIRGLAADLKKAGETIENNAEEKKILSRNINKLKTELSRYTGDGEKVELPAGLKGKVLAVNPKYDFVVIDIGANQGALERGELLVNRGGRLVAKLKITSVQADRSIANVVTEWKQAEVLEGDVVLR